MRTREGYRLTLTQVSRLKTCCMTTDAAPDLHGQTDPRFEPVRLAVAKQLGTGAEVGMSIVVDLDGERVVDLWGGHRDAARS